MGQRADRVASLIVQEVSQIIREDVSQPDIGFITIMGAKVADDLKTAVIHYSVLGTADQKHKTQKSLDQSSGYIRKLLNDRLSLRFAIAIRFEVDTSMDHSFKIESILDQIRRERESHPENPKS